jgi:hypothetical protein
MIIESNVQKVMRLEKICLTEDMFIHTYILQNNILEHQFTVARGFARVVARLEVSNGDLFQSIRHGSLHIFNSPKIVSFQAAFESGKQKEIGRARSGL